MGGWRLKRFSGLAYQTSKHEEVLQVRAAKAEVCFFQTQAET
jgi:hypothetical protein